LVLVVHESTSSASMRAPGNGTDLVNIITTWGTADPGAEIINWGSVERRG
jgi:hypothetical protein